MARDSWDDYTALLARIRHEYDRLPHVPWFKQAYIGKSMGDTIRSEEDALLYMADPEYAASLGITPPLCRKCGGEIRRPPSTWTGEPLVHAIPKYGCRNGSDDG